MNLLNVEENVRVIARVRPPLDEFIIRLMKQSLSDEYLTYISAQPCDDQTLKISPNYRCACPACVSKYSMEVKIEQYGSLSRTKHDKLFKFTRVFGWDSTQQQLFQEVSSYIDAALDGYNAAVVSIGPSKSGKSYSLYGPAENEGIIPQAFVRLFQVIEQRKRNDPTLITEVEMSFIELNNNHFRNLLKEDDDRFSNGNLGSTSQILLSTDEFDEIRGVIKSLNHVDPTHVIVPNNKIEVKESQTLGIYFNGPNLRVPVRSVEEAYSILKRADKIRANKSIGIDGISFKGHAILTIHVDSRVNDRGATGEAEPWISNALPESSLKLGKLQFVDLASAERMSENKFSSDQLADALYVNKSLSALVDVFHCLSVNSALSKRKSRANLTAVNDADHSNPSSTPPVTAKPANSEMHVPYLNSKLTHALKDIIGGNAKTTFVFNLAPEADYYHPNIIAVQNVTKLLKVYNVPKVNRIAVPEDFLPDEFSELSYISQLRQYYVEPLLKSCARSFRKSMSLSVLKDNNNNNNNNIINNNNNINPKEKLRFYNLSVRSIVLRELPELSLPMLPWMKLEVGSTVTKSPKLLYSRGVATFNDVINFEVDQYDLEAGIPLEIRVYAKRPYRYRLELGRGRLILKNAFPVLEEITEVEILLYRLAGNGRIVQQGRVGINGIFRLSNSKSALYDLRLITPKKSALNLGDDEGEERDRYQEEEEDEPILLSVRKFSSHDAFIALVDHADAIGSYKFSLEVKLGSETYRTPYIPGKGRYRGKEVIANVLFQDPDLHFEVKKSHLRTEQLQLLLYVQGCSAETLVVGRTIISLQSMVHLHDEEILDINSQIRNISNTVTGKVNISLSLSAAGMKQRIAIAENYAANLIANAFLPEDFENGWIRISSIIAARINTLKLLGNEMRYEYNIDKFEQHTKQDLLLSMEYKDSWTSVSTVLTDQRDYCNWRNADFKLCIQRKDLLYQPIKFSVFNRKLEGKNSLIGTSIVYLHQLCYEKSLLIHELPIALTGLDGKPAGVLILEGMIVKDNGNTWVSATVVKVRQGGRYDVRYEDGQIEENVSKDLIKPDLTASTSLTRSATQTTLNGSGKAKPKFAVGMVVEVVDAKGENWFPAQIALIHPNGTYDVKCQYHDVPKTHLNEQHIRFFQSTTNNVETGSSSGDLSKGLPRQASKTTLKQKFTLQDKVEVNYKSKGKWYPCKIWKVHVSTDGKYSYDVDFNSGNREFGVPEDRLRKQAVGSPALLSKSTSLFNVKGAATPQTPKSVVQSNNTTSTPNQAHKSTPNVKKTGSGDTVDSKSSIYNKYSTASSRMKTRSPSSVQQNFSNDGAAKVDKRRASVGNLVTKEQQQSKLKKTTAQATNGVNSSNRRNSVDSSSGTGGTGGTGHNLHVQNLLASTSTVFPLPELHTLTFDTLDATSVLTDNENDDLDLLESTNTPNRAPETVETLLGSPTNRALAVEEDGEEPLGVGKYAFVLGDRVEVNFRMIGKWYPGFIKRCRGNGIYDIDYDDGSMESRVDGDYIRLMEILETAESKYRPGDAVEANVNGLGYWYPAIITKVRSQGKYDIQYDNGDQDFLVTERLLRFQRMDSIIPKIKPFFSLGDRIYVKTRSSTLDTGIKQYREMQRQANQDLFGVFKIMKRMEDEEGFLNLAKKKTRFIFTSLLILKEDVRSLSGTKSFFEENGELKLKQSLENHEKTIQQLEMVLLDCEEEIATQKSELRKALADVAAIQRKNGDFRSIAVSSRAGVEEEEFHALTLAQENVKEEIKSLERTRARALEVIDALSAARHQAQEKLKSVINAIKAAKLMVEHVLDQELEESPRNILEPITPSSQTPTKAKKSASNEVDYGNIYGSNTRDGDDVDIGYDNVYGGESFDSYSTRGAADTVVDVYMPVYDDRYLTGLGGLLLGEKKPFSDTNSNSNNDELSNSRELPKRRHSSTDATLTVIATEKYPSVDRRLKLTKHYYLNATNQTNTAGNRFLSYNVNFDGKTFTIILNSNSSNGTTNNANGNNENRLSLGANRALPDGSIPPPPEQVTPLPLTKEDIRILEKKKAAEEKKARASIAQAAYFRYVITLANDREQCDQLNKEIEDFIEENDLHFVLDNKFGVTYEASKARIQPMLAIALECDQRRIATEESAFKYQSEALKCYEKALNARRTSEKGMSVPNNGEGTYNYLSPAEIMKLWDATKASYVMEWSTWEEARVMIEEEKAAYKNVIITINRSYRDLSQLTKIRNDVTTYLTMRQEYFEKKLLLTNLKLKREEKLHEFERMKEEIMNEANVNELVIKAMTPQVSSSDGGGGGGGNEKSGSMVGNNGSGGSGNRSRPQSFRQSFAGVGGSPSFTFSPFANDSGGNHTRRASRRPQSIRLN